MSEENEYCTKLFVFNGSFMEAVVLFKHIAVDKHEKFNRKKVVKHALVVEWRERYPRADKATKNERKARFEKTIYFQCKYSACEPLIKQKNAASFRP